MKLEAGPGVFMKRSRFLLLGQVPLTFNLQLIFKSQRPI